MRRISSASLGSGLSNARDHDRIIGSPRPRPRYPPVVPRAAPALCLAATLLVALPAGADLPGDAARLAQPSKNRGATVTRLDPIFLERGRAKTLTTEPSAPGDIKGCLTVAFIAVRTAEFSIQTEDQRPPPTKNPQPALSPRTPHKP